MSVLQFGSGSIMHALNVVFTYKLTFSYHSYSLMQQLSQELEQDDARTFRHQVGSPVTNSPPGDYLVPIFLNPEYIYDCLQYLSVLDRHSSLYH